MMKLRSGVGIALVGAGLVALSCNADRRSMALEASADASVSTTASVDTVVESRVASTRVAELRARFRLPVPVATRFESAAGADAATHMRAVLPSEALRGVTRAARVALPVRPRAPLAWAWFTGESG